MVFRMATNPVAPSGTTQAFRAFTEKPEPVAAAPSRTPLLVAGAVAAVVLLALLAWLVLS